MVSLSGCVIRILAFALKVRCILERLARHIHVYMPGTYWSVARICGVILVPNVTIWLAAMPVRVFRTHIPFDVAFGEFASERYVSVLIYLNHLRSAVSVVCSLRLMQ